MKIKNRMHIIIRGLFRMIKKMFFTLVVLSLSTSVFAQDTTDTVTDDTIYTDNTNNSTVKSDSNSNATIKSPPPSAISPSINGSNSDLCTIGVAGAVQTQILGISAAKTVSDMNCEKLKNAKTLYDMGMKVAAVSVMCEDNRVFTAMMNAGTPCPFDGLIGSEAKDAWNSPDNKHLRPDSDKKRKVMSDDTKSTLGGVGVVGGLLLLLLL